MEKIKEDSEFKLKFGYSATRFVAATCLQNIMNLPKLAIPGSRDWLAEPWNFVNHSGNAAVSAYIGIASGRWGGIAYERFRKNNNEASARKRARVAMAAAGLAVGFVANAAIETKLGLKITHYPDTPDPLDLVYGVTSATYAAAVGPTIQVDKFTGPETTSEPVACPIADPDSNS